MANHKVGDKVYVVCGVEANPHACTPERYYIQTRKVLKIGRYVTLGLDGFSPSQTERFIPSTDPFDFYSIFYGQGSGKSYIGKEHSVTFGIGQITHAVFKTREEAERFLYDINGNLMYTYVDPVSYPGKKYNGTGTARLESFNADVDEALRRYGLK